MNPSQDCLAKLFDAVNSIDISKAPVLSRFEKLIMRTSERKDVFIEKFEEFTRRNNLDNVPGTARPPSLSSKRGHQANDSLGSHSSFEDGVVARSREKDKGKEKERSLTSLHQHGQYSPSGAEFTLDGSAVWVGDESGLDQIGVSNHPGLPNNNATLARGRSSTDASSSSSLGRPIRREEPSLAPTSVNNPTTLKDTHFFPATMDYNDHLLPIRLPLSTFPEEVGDVSYILLSSYCSCALTRRSVFPYPACADLLVCDCQWTSTPTPPYQRVPDSPSNHLIQRINYRKADHIPWTPSTRWSSFQLCPLCLRTWLRMWDRLERVHQAGLSLCEPHESR